VTISGGNLGSPILRRKTITVLPHAGATVHLGDLVGKILFAQREQLKVEVADAAHRESWVRTYPIIFTLG
jgi:hypothetical protein